MAKKIFVFVFAILLLPSIVAAGQSAPMPADGLKFIAPAANLPVEIRSLAGKKWRGITFSNASYGQARQEVFLAVEEILSSLQVRIYLSAGDVQALSAVLKEFSGRYIADLTKEGGIHCIVETQGVKMDFTFIPKGEGVMGCYVGLSHLRWGRGGDLYPVP